MKSDVIPALSKSFAKPLLVPAIGFHRYTSSKLVSFLKSITLTLSPRNGVTFSNNPAPISKAGLVNLPVVGFHVVLTLLRAVKSNLGA